MVYKTRRGIARLIAFDSDNARGADACRTLPCVVSVGRRVDYAGAPGGTNIKTTPYVVAEHNAGIREGDMMRWRGRRFQAGAVSRPTLDGGGVCLQARLKEVEP